MNEEQYDLVIVGAGAGGIGAAWAAARRGIRTLLVEREACIGGTAVLAGVSVWEMSVSGTGISAELYRRMAQHPLAVGIYSFGHHCCWPTPGSPVYPGGQLLLDPQRSYADTLRRYGAHGMAEDEAFVRRTWHGVPFEPEVYSRVAMAMLAETGHCTLLTHATLGEIDAQRGGIRASIVRQGDQARRVTARIWIDCTGESTLCRQLGCEMLFGSENRAVFGEASAPTTAHGESNGVTLIYRVTRDRACWLPMMNVPTGCWWRADFPYACNTEYPNGDWHINMLPTMEGAEYRAMPFAEAYAECRRRVWAHWRWLQTRWRDFAEYGICWIAPRLGVREGARVRCAYMLTEHDLRAGLSRQAHADIIAIADHAIDMHGSENRGGCCELSAPYGIPFRCLQPLGWDNLLVASRGAGFSHIAASSCRLTRTMLQLGQAAGSAAALAIQRGCQPRDLSPDALRACMTDQGVILDLGSSTVDAKD